MGDLSESVIQELAKINTKLTILCQDVEELKKFHKETIQSLTNLADRIEHLEKWREDFYNFLSKVQKTVLEIDKRLVDVENWKENVKIEEIEKKRFSRDTIAAIVGGFAGGVASAIVLFFTKLV